MYYHQLSLFRNRSSLFFLFLLAVDEGQRVVLIDDLIATGGTALAALELLRKAGAAVEQALFLIDLPDLGGAERLRQAGLEVAALIDFPGH